MEDNVDNKNEADNSYENFSLKEKLQVWFWAVFCSLLGGWGVWFAVSSVMKGEFMNKGYMVTAEESPAFFWGANIVGGVVSAVFLFFGFVLLKMLIFGRKEKG